MEIKGRNKGTSGLANSYNDVSKDLYDLISIANI